MQSTYSLVKDGIVACAWNKDRSHICIAPSNSNDILIFNTGKSKDITTWKLTQVLEEHNQQVSGLDWNAINDKIISCGHDKNVIVYTLEKEKWTPSLVILSSLERAALCVRWDTVGTLFGVGTGNKRIILGYYEENNDWWTSVSFKVHDSSVIAISFHPKLPIIASASTDKKIVISSCFIAEIKTNEGKQFSDYGEVFYTMNCGSWVNDVCWSISGNTLAGVGHNSQLHILNTKDIGNIESNTMQLRDRPFYRVVFSSDNDLFCCGYDRIPIHYKRAGEVFREHKKLDDVSTTKERQKTEMEMKRSIFEQKKLGQASEEIEFLQVPKTKHKNTIIAVSEYASGMLFTCDLSGYICFWQY